MPHHIVQGLKDLGHIIEEIPKGGVTQAIRLDAAGELVGVNDPRVPGKVGYASRDEAQ